MFNQWIYIEAHGARLPRLVEVVKALAIADLEARGGYVEAHHDPFFERYDEHALTADELSQFPDYLVCIPPGSNAGPQNANLMEMLSSGLPVSASGQEASRHCQDRLHITRAVKHPDDFQWVCLRPIDDEI